MRKLFGAFLIAALISLPVAPAASADPIQQTVHLVNQTADAVQDSVSTTVEDGGRERREKTVTICAIVTAVVVVVDVACRLIAVLT